MERSGVNNRGCPMMLKCRSKAECTWILVFGASVSEVNAENDRLRRLKLELCINLLWWYLYQRLRNVCWTWTCTKQTNMRERKRERQREPCRAVLSLFHTTIALAYSTHRVHFKFFYDSNALRLTMVITHLSHEHNVHVSSIRATFLISIIVLLPTYLDLANIYKRYTYYILLETYYGEN